MNQICVYKIIFHLMKANHIYDSRLKNIIKYNIYWINDIFKILRTTLIGKQLKNFIYQLNKEKIIGIINKHLDMFDVSLIPLANLYGLKIQTIEDMILYISKYVNTDLLSAANQILTFIIDYEIKFNYNRDRIGMLYRIESLIYADINQLINDTITLKK